MRQLLKPKPETIQQQNAALKAKLARADRLIAQLKAETSQLRGQLAQRQRRSTAPQATVSLPRTVARSPVDPSRRRPAAVDNVTSLKQPQQAAGSRSSRSARRRRSTARLRRRLGILLSFAIVLTVAAVFSMQRRQQQTSAPPLQPTAQPQLHTPTLQTPTAAAVNQKQTIEALVYNVQPAPLMEHSEALQAIVDGAVALAASQSLPTEPLSMTLIDLKTNTIAGYQKEIPRYPASVAKLFWLVVCEAQLENGILQPDPALSADLTAMIVNSDNDAASRIFDRITQTTSGGALSGEAYDTWLKHRLRLNQFFRAAGYDGLSISQKNYPIYSLKLDEPDGRELQMRDEQQQPIRSLVTSDQAARLMYEIYAGKAVSASRSQEMLALLTRDLTPESWKQQPDNPIAGFLGESLPVDIRFASKVGLTTKARHEVALIESKDGKVSYILAVFGADPTYSQNSEILPAISNAVYTQMMERSAHADVMKKNNG